MIGCVLDTIKLDTPWRVNPPTYAPCFLEIVSSNLEKGRKRLSHVRIEYKYWLKLVGPFTQQPAEISFFENGVGHDGQER